MDTAYSRFDQTDPVIFDGCETYGRWSNPLTAAIYNNMFMFTVKARYEGRPDLIASQLYGNSSLDWILITVNNATESLNWPRAGDTIYVPDPKVLSSELL